MSCRLAVPQARQGLCEVKVCGGEAADFSLVLVYLDLWKHPG